ncbi:MAG TPA: type II toxin-antitoxin system HicA family toxin [Anaerolineae bacterium]|nr:type II toxin-antitoxin system HicA family toxin [Anaerolineae bacterium]
MRYRDVAQRLRELGCTEMREGKGSHRVWHNPTTGLIAVILDWGSKDLAPGTVRAVIRELGINRQEFGPIK